MAVPSNALPDLPSFNGTARTDLRARAAYSEAAGIYRVVPDAVAIPSTTKALRELVAWAAHRRVPLVPRGAGSGMAGGNLGSGVLLDLSVLDGAPIRVDAGARRAATGAAVTLRDLNSAAGAHGLHLPPDPSSARFATLGGMVSTNASGPRSVRSGSVRRWVEAAEFLTADGELLQLHRGAPTPPSALAHRAARSLEPVLKGARATILDRFPRIRKNSTGYALDAWLRSGDLLDLVIGAEGTLGVVTAVEWRLETIPAVRIGLRAALRDTDALGAMVSRLLPLEPAAVEYLDQSFLRFVGEDFGGAAGLLMVEFEGEDPALPRAALAEARTILAPAAEAVVEASGEKALEALWGIRHAANPMLARLGQERRSMQVIEDGCVPVEALPRYIEAVRAAGRRHEVELVMFGHVGDGNLHVNILPDVTVAGWERPVAALFAEVSEAVVTLGGSPSGEHGDGRLRTGLLRSVYGAEVAELFRLVKETFDPVGIFNPGVKVPTGTERPLAALKVGAGAAPIPADIEAALRDVERYARYGVARLDLADQAVEAALPA